MVNRNLTPRRFDNTKELVSTRYQPVDGVQTKPGQKLPADLNASVRLRLWMSGRAMYADDYKPTPVAAADDAADDAAVIEAAGAQLLDDDGNPVEVPAGDITDPPGTIAPVAEETAADENKAAEAVVAAAVKEPAKPKGRARKP